MKRITILILIIVSLASFFDELPKSSTGSNSNLEVHFLDVGQGDATLIKSPKNNWALIDAGRSDNIISEIERVAPQLKTFEFIILTHADLDHIEGMFSILKKYEVRKIFLEKTLKDSPLFKELLESINNKSIKTLYLTKESDFYFDSIEFDILWPLSLKEIVTSAETNELSITVLLKFKDFKLFMAGDLYAENEETLSEIYNLRNLDVLKVSHHGSKTSSSEKFLKIVSPKTSIISVGEENSYGLPNRDVLERLDRHSEEIYRTDIHGGIKLSINDNDDYKISFTN